MIGKGFIYWQTISFILFFTYHLSAANDSVKIYLDKGWAALVIDNDNEALNHFAKAYEIAKQSNDLENSAEALLNMGICTYGVSPTKGLDYCLQAMKAYEQLANKSALKALNGRCRCLQLMSTIQLRQGEYKTAIRLSKEAMLGFPNARDTSNYLGLIYNSLGTAYQRLQMSDSAAYFHQLALKERLLTKSFIYLPGTYISIGDIALEQSDFIQSFKYYQRAFAIADSTGNRQAQSSALICIGNWYLKSKADKVQAEIFYLKAKAIAASLSDQSFYLTSLKQLLALKQNENDYRMALFYAIAIQNLKDSLYTTEKLRIQNSLEIQFKIEEKDEQVKLANREKDVAQLTAYLLWAIIGFVVLISIAIILYLRRNNQRNQLLLRTKEELVTAIEAQRQLKEQQFQNELEFKESQLSAMTLQMLQKNELMQALKERMSEDENLSGDKTLNQIIKKGISHEKEWKDFNTYFESINKNFNERLKKAYPDISPNDLRMCALIKLNLSIKEMASILNISPDSVKTARYRLRKKLQMNTEDNLTEFIVQL